MARNKIQKRSKYDNAAYLFIAPFVILAIFFMLYPILKGFYSSLFNSKWAGDVFVGLDNYKKIFTNPVYLKAIRNTLIYVVTVVPLLIVLGIWIAGSVFDKHPKYVTFVRVCLYLPVICSMVVMSIIWRYILDSQNGLVKYFSTIFGGQPVNLLASEKTAVILVIFVLFTMNIGQTVLLYIADMISIPKDLFEAATIDGATRTDLFRYLLIPLTKPTSIFIFITQTSAVLKVFVVIQLLTKGGPNYGTTSLMYLLYQEGFENSNTGLACAIGVLMFVISLGLIMLQFAANRKKEV